MKSRPEAFKNDSPAAFFDIFLLKFSLHGGTRGLLRAKSAVPHYRIDILLYTTGKGRISGGMEIWIAGQALQTRWNCLMSCKKRLEKYGKRRSSVPASGTFPHRETAEKKARNFMW